MSTLLSKARAFLEPLGLSGRGLKHDPDKWRKVAQEGEFHFHLRDKKRRSDFFDKNSAALFEYFGLSKDNYRGSTIIDLGAGSKLRTRYFDDAKIIAIEPLADRFIKEIPWCDLKTAWKVFSKPAEERIQECVAAADLLVSINVLDHCFDFEVIVGNIRDYLKPSGLAFLSFDAHDKADEMHPLILNEAICERIFSSKGLKIEKVSKGFGDKKDIISKGRDTYGHGEFCLNYWLRRA